MSSVRIVPAGDSALVVEFEERIDPAINARVIALAERLDAADEVVVAPVFRSTLPESERLSIPQLVGDVTGRGRRARAAESLDGIVRVIVREHRRGDLVVLMSNGGFGGIHQKLVQALGTAVSEPRAVESGSGP